VKACVLHKIGDLRYEEVDNPLPGKNEVLLEIKACGICGSDIPRVYLNGTYHFPTIPGHEFSGQVIKLGEDVDKSLLGKKAAVFPLIPCMKCDMCRIGEYAQCKNYNYFGSRCDGGFAEYISVPVWNLMPVPDNVSYEEAAMAEPAAVAVHALRQAGIEIGDKVAIYGAGPIGLMLGKWAQAWGAGTVMLVDIDEGKINFAREMGFENLCNSKGKDPVQWIKELTGGRGADLAVEGAGVSTALEQCLFSVRPLGRIVAMGNPAGNMKLSQKSYWELLRKQLKIYGTWNSRFAVPKNDWNLVVDAMARGTINVKPFITHRFTLCQCDDAFRMMRDKTGFFNKVMFIR
jgi:L-iditol 2-dehydrogenase